MTPTDFHAGPYFLVTAAGVVGNHPKGEYPRWLRIYLILLVSGVWAGMLVAVWAGAPIKIPGPVHGIMGLVVASLFRIEFGSIRLEKRENDDRNAQ